MGGNRPPKRLFLGAALREARNAAGYTNLTEFAKKIGRTPAALSRWETGDRTPNPTDVAAFLTACGVTGQRYDEILELAHDTDAPLWIAVSLLEQRQHLDALLAFERDATELTCVSPLLIPGLLQTEGYIRGIMTAGGVPEDEIETRVRVRLGRQDILETVHLTALIGHATLRQEIGGRAVLLGQLRHLTKMAGHRNVTLRVVPFRTGWNPSLEGSWTVIQSAAAPAVIHQENRRSGLFWHEPEDLATYREAVEFVTNVAMSPEESAGLIAKEMNELEME